MLNLTQQLSSSSVPISTMQDYSDFATSENPYTNPIDKSRCHFPVYDSEHKIDSLLFFLHITFEAFSSIVELIYECRECLIIATIATFVVYVWYKSYWKPPLYIKECTEVGFEHVASAQVSRARRLRRLGSKPPPPPYPDGWFAVAESRGLGRGEVRPVDVLGHNLCVYRGESGTAVCVDAYCPHLGANLGAGGTVSGDCVTCPFHQWKFDETGTCVSVPGLEHPPRGVKLRTWHTREVDGAVWIWHSSSEEPPRWFVEESPQLARWGYRGRNEYTVNSHVMDIPENGADMAHFAVVHSTSLLTDLGRTYPFLLNFVGQHTWQAEWEKGEDHTSSMTLSHDYSFGKHPLGLAHLHAHITQIGPGHVRLLLSSAVGSALVVQSVTPLSPLEQKVVHRFYSPWYNAPIIVSAILRGESHMFERDLSIWNNKRYVTSPSYVRTDRKIREFRAWFSQFYSDASMSFVDALRRQRDPLDW